MNQGKFRKALTYVNSYCKEKIGNQSEVLRTTDISKMSDCALKRYISCTKKGLNSITGNNPALVSSLICGGSSMHEKAIREIATVINDPKHFNTTPECESLRRCIIDVITENFSCKQMTDLGFSLNSRKESHRRKREELPPTPPSKKRKSNMTPTKKKKLFNLCSSDDYSKSGRRSVLAPNENGEKEKQDVRHFIKPISRIIKNYSPVKRKEVSETVARQTIREFKIFKKPDRETSVCVHCKKRRAVVKWLNMNSLFHYNFDRHKSYSKRYPSKYSWSRFVAKHLHDEFARKLALLKVYDHHLRMHERVLNEQRKRRANHPTDLVTWIFDFKNSIVVGDGPENQASRKRKQSLVSIFNITAEYRDSPDQPLQRIYFIVVSNTQSHDGYSTIDMVKACQRCPEAKPLLKKSRHEYKSDGASSNINGEVSHHILIDFPNERHHSQVSFAPYCRNHGKCISDTIFHFIDQWVEIGKNGRDVLNVPHVVKVIRDNLNEINASKTDDQEKMNMVVIKHTTRTKRSNYKKVFKIDGIQSTCCVTWNRDTNTIVNNIFPDVDRTKGVPCPVNKNTILSIERTNATTKKYRAFCDAEEGPDIIERQQSKRETWLKMEKYWK